MSTELEHWALRVKAQKLLFDELSQDIHTHPLPLSFTDIAAVVLWYEIFETIPELDDTQIDSWTTQALMLSPEELAVCISNVLAFVKQKFQVILNQLSDEPVVLPTDFSLLRFFTKDVHEYFQISDDPNPKLVVRPLILKQLGVLSDKRICFLVDAGVFKNYNTSTPHKAAKEKIFVDPLEVQEYLAKRKLGRPHKNKVK